MGTVRRMPHREVGQACGGSRRVAVWLGAVAAGALLLCLAVFLPVAGVLAAPAQVQGIALAVTPATQTTTAGEIVTVSLQVEAGSQRVDGVQIDLRFPAALLEVVDADPAASGVQITRGSTLPTYLQNTVDNAAGRIRYAAGIALGSDRVSGTFELASVRFRAKAGGTASLEFSTDLLVTSAGEGLPVSVRNGQINVIMPKALMFAAQPVKAAHGFTFGVQPVVGMEESGQAKPLPLGTIVTLRLRPGSGTPGAVLACTEGLSRTADSGIGAVSFAGCTIDLHGNAYVLEATADGFFPATSQPFDVNWAGDASGDCAVAGLDFSILALHYDVGKVLVDPVDLARRADFDGDSRVDLRDFSILASSFATRCPA